MANDTNTSVPVTDHSVSNPASLAELRLKIRDAVLSAKPKTQIVEAFGQQIEIRQPTLDAVMGYQQLTDRTEAAAQMLIRYAYVPGTNTRVFDEEDIHVIKNVPFGNDMQVINDAINEMMDLRTAAKEEEKN
jgi:hypothetical protein